MARNVNATTGHSLKVALVTETYPPEVNGVAATVSQLVQGLRQRGHQLRLVRPRQGQADSAAAADGLTEVLLPGMPIPRYPELKCGLPAGRTLRQLWALHRPDVVHVVTEGPLGWSALRAAARLQIPVVSDFRTNFQAYSTHYGVGWLHRPILAYLRSFHNRAACTMVPTDTVRVELSSQGFKRLRVVSRGVDTQRFNPTRRNEALRNSWGAGPQTLVLLCVGRLAPEKNLGLVLEAYDAVRAANPQVKLVLVGDGPEKTRLAQSRPDVLFPGLRHGDDLAAHYASADVFLFPSLTETFGNVVTEAMASGLPVVAYNRAAAAQHIRHGHNGLLVRSGDAASFCSVSGRLVANRDWTITMGAEARQTTLGLSWAGIAESVEAEYHSALKLSRPSLCAAPPEAVPTA